MKRNLVVLRTHVFDDFVYEVCCDLSKIPDFDFCVAVDETQSEVQVASSFEKVSLNKNFIDRNRLANAERVGWACGDYFLYAAHEAHGDYQHYWLIEPDMYPNFESYAEFFALANIDATTDFIAVGFDRAPDNWVWSKSMTDEFALYGCLFPVVRISRPAVEFLLNKRRELLTSNHSLKLLEYPNDEIFCATHLANSGFTCKAFKQLKFDINNVDSFNIIRPFPYRHMKNLDSDNTLYHPVTSHPVLYYKFKWIIEHGDDKALEHVVKYLPLSKNDIIEDQFLELVDKLSSRLAFCG